MAERLGLPEQDVPIGVSIIRQNSVAETYPSHCHDFYEIFFVGSGKGSHLIGNRRLLLEKGSLVLIRPDDVHSFCAFNAFDFSMYSVGFTAAEMERALAYMGIPKVAAHRAELPPCMVLHGQERAAFEQQLEEMLQLRREERRTAFRAMLPGVLLRLLGGGEPSGRAPAIFPAWLSRLDDLMSLQENYIPGLPRMLALCPCTQAYMNRAFKRYMKLTPTEYINTKRMHYASQLLVEQRYDIAEVCYMTGFNNLSHFYTVFRSIYHCTPKTFVERHRQESGKGAWV